MSAIFSQTAISCITVSAKFVIDAGFGLPLASRSRGGLEARHGLLRALSSLYHTRFDPHHRLLRLSRLRLPSRRYKPFRTPSELGVTFVSDRFL